MGDAVATRAALTRLGMVGAVATYCTDSIGLDSLDEWRDLDMDNHFKELTKNLRTPGGGHPGFEVSVVLVNKLKILRLGLKYNQKVQRTVNAVDVNQLWITNHKFVLAHKLKAKDKQADDDNLPKITMADWAKNKEVILLHFSEVYGEDDIPLGYLLRDDVAVLPEAADPQVGYDNDHDKELIRRTAHTGEAYRNNNKTLCRLLKKICEDTAAYSLISNMTSGRAAWLKLMCHYLGPQTTQLQAGLWEAKIRNAKYTGESARFTFEKYCDIHELAHTRLTALEANGYRGMDEGTKIRHFLDGIKCKALETPIELVRGNRDFDTYATASRRLKDSIIAAEPALKARRNVSDMHQQDPFPNVEADMNVEDKFYTPEAWAKLSKAKKKGVLKKRASRSKNSSKKDTKKNHDRAIKALKKQHKQENGELTKRLEKMERKVAAVKKLDADDDMDISDSSDEDQSEDEAPTKRTTTGNRSNPATTRAKKGKKGKKQ